MSMSIADIFLSARLDPDGKLLADVTKAAGQAGAAGEKRLSASLGSALRRTIGPAFGATLGIGFAMATTGAIQLDNATRQLQADAGLTATEAKAAEHAIAGIYQNNLQGFDAIGRAMAKVHIDMGLTGQAADDTTARFTKFSTATGQDAAEAVTSFDDVLDAFNLKATDSGELMDKLVLSHQRFGGVIPESESALAKMAPALGAANLGLDSGIALLNLFNAAGIDASKAPQALAHALSLVKSPEELRKLIQDITDTKDPFERAQKAIALFGARAGPQLAQALAQGNLDDFKISMDDAAGATDKAAAAVESGFGAQFTLLLHKAGGALAEFGQNFGPLLMVASAFGPKLLTTLGSALGGLAGFFGPKLLALVVGPAIATGMTTGAAMGGAAASTAVAVEGAEVTAGQAVVAAEATPAAMAAGRTLGRAMGLAIKAGVVIGIVGLGAALAIEVAGLNDPRHRTPSGRLFRGTNVPSEQLANQLDVAKRLQERADAGDRFAAQQLAAVKANIARLESVIAAADAQAAADAKAAGAAVPTSFADGVKAALPAVEVAAADVVKTFGTAMTFKGIGAVARQTGADAMSTLAQGIESARQKPLDAFATLGTMLKHEMSSTQEAARLAGQLTSKELAKGLRSKDPEVRAQATAVQKIITDRLLELRGVHGLGQKAMDELAAGMKSKDPAIRTAAASVTAALNAEWEKLKADATRAGTDAGAALAEAIRLSVLRAQSYIDSIHGTTVTAPTSPKPKKLHSGIQSVPATGPFILQEGEMVIRAAEAAAVRAGRAAVTSAGARATGGDVYNNTITLNGLPQASDPFEVTRQMSRLANLGLLRSPGG